jgi:ERCC4-related helicase
LVTPAVFLCVPAGSGKTLIAAEVIRHKLPALHQANKVAVFLAPTNPLTDQVRPDHAELAVLHCTVLLYRIMPGMPCSIAMCLCAWKLLASIQCG